MTLKEGLDGRMVSYIFVKYRKQTIKYLIQLEDLKAKKSTLNFMKENTKQSFSCLLVSFLLQHIPSQFQCLVQIFVLYYHVVTYKETLFKSEV